MTAYEESTNNYKLYTPPVMSEWKCILSGSEAYGVVYRPAKGEEPNWFWRKMQYLCFGVRWVTA